MMFEQKLTFSLLIFCSPAAIWLWFVYFFSIFFFRISLDGFPNLLIVQSGTRFDWMWGLVFLRFLTFQRIWIVLVCCHVLSSINNFSWFFESNSNDDFGHVKTRTRSKNRVVLWRFLLSCQSSVRKWCLTEFHFLASGFLFTCGILILVFTVFDVFYIYFFQCFSFFNRTI